MIEEVRLDDLITLQRGFDISEKEQLEGNVPVISSGGFSSYHNEYKVTGPGVVIGRKGTLGKVFYTTENYWPHSTSLWVKDFKGNDPKFIYYLLQVLHFEKFDSGAANPTLNRNHIHSLKIKVPKKKYRSPIASILSAYDELIENNKQRIKLLEEMAEEIYKEWFVRLRFPNYENTEFVDGLPKGWRIVRLKECFEHYIGGGWGEDTPSVKNNEPAYVIRGTDIPNAKVGNLNFEVLRYHSASNLSNRRLQANDIVFEVSGGTETQSLGRSLLISKSLIDRFDEDLICASFCKLIRAKQSLTSGLFIYLLLSRLYKTGEIMLYQVQSTGISNYKFEDFIEKQKVQIPTTEIQSAFNEIIQPMFDEIQMLGAKNQLLQQTRDLLLPRLISGKLSVEELAEAKEYVLGQNAEQWPMAAEAEGEYHH